MNVSPRVLAWFVVYTGNPLENIAPMLKGGSLLPLHSLDLSGTSIEMNGGVVAIFHALSANLSKDDALMDGIARNSLRTSIVFACLLLPPNHYTHSLLSYIIFDNANIRFSELLPPQRLQCDDDDSFREAQRMHESIQNDGALCRLCLYACCL